MWAVPKSKGKLACLREGDSVAQTHWSLVEHDPNHPVAPDRWRSSDVTLVFTREGIRVSGYYDTCVGIGPEVTIPWAEVDAYRRKTNR